MTRRLRTAIWLLALAASAWAQDGGAIYRARCAGCHEAASGRIPPVSVLRAMPAAAILDVLENGVMKAQAAGLSAAQVPQLKLKWSFSLGANPRSQPAVIGGTVYVGAGKLYALDVQTGCTEWVFASDAPVRSGLTVGAAPGQELAVFFGDSKPTFTQ